MLESDKRPRRPPSDFETILKTAEPVLVVGGQAVNLWALLYSHRVERFSPFTSSDLDVLGNRATLESLASVAKAKAQLFPLKPPSNEVGVVIVKTADGRELLVEVLRYIEGVTNPELEESAFTFQVGSATARVPSPIVLLRTKISNVASISQEGRQDEKHVRILASIMPEFLNSLVVAVRQGRMDERGLVGRLEQLLAVVTGRDASRVLAALGIAPEAMFAELDVTGLVKPQRFLTNRLRRVLLGG
jgi:hypothetical protein